LIGFLFGPIALITAVGQSDRNLKEINQELYQNNKNNNDFLSDDSKQRTLHSEFSDFSFQDNRSARELKESKEKK
jgi:hypothetical protein